MLRGQPGGGNVAGLLDGKRAFVVGVANKRSIAWSIARAFDGAGATQVLSFQNDRVEAGVRKLGDTLTTPVAAYVPLDVSNDAELDAAVAAAAEAMGGIDILVHAVAFANPDDLGGRYVDTSREGFMLAMDISAYSLTALAQRVEPHMEAAGGGSIMSMT